MTIGLGLFRVVCEAVRRRLDSHLDHGEHGASLVEYALLVTLIALIAFGALELIGVNLSARFQEFAALFTG